MMLSVVRGVTRRLKVQRVRLAFIREAVRDYLNRVEAVERVQGLPAARTMPIFAFRIERRREVSDIDIPALSIAVTQMATGEPSRPCWTEDDINADFGVMLEANAGAGVSADVTASEPRDWQPGPTPVLGGLMSQIDDSGASSVFSSTPAVWGYGLTPGATVRDYAHSLTDPYETMQRYIDDWPSMPMRSLSNDNHDRVWIAQGDDVRAMGVGDTPQEAAIEYARAVADLLRPTGGPDALDSKAAIRRQLAACRGECGDGPPTWEEWSR